MWHSATQSESPFTTCQPRRKRRGLIGVELVVSDAHGGLLAAFRWDV
ncbi:MAG: transposase [Gemmatimonadota bacterium]